MISSNFVLLALVLNLWGSVGYAYLTLKGKIKPNRVTFFLWALAPLIAFGAEINKDVGIQSLMTFMVGLGPLMVLIASFMNKSTYWKLKKFDYVCGGLSVGGLALWAITGEGNLAIAFAILADGLAALPTVYKSYIAPMTENWLLYFLSALSAAITLLTIDKWTFAYWGFPVYILAICILISALVKFKLGKKFPIRFAI